MWSELRRKYEEKIRGKNKKNRDQIRNVKRDIIREASGKHQGSILRKKKKKKKNFLLDVTRKTRKSPTA